MRVNIPTIEKSFNETTNLVETKSGFLPVDIDTSLQAHLKWEEQFQSTVGCDLITYTERIQPYLKDVEKAKANFLSLLKVLYCYVNSPQLPTFKEFLGLFHKDNMMEVINKIITVVEEVGKTATKN